LKGDRKARSTDDEVKPAADEPGDAMRPSADLRLALIGGALASLAVSPTAGAETAATAGDAETPSSARPTKLAEAPAPANSEAPPAGDLSGARLTAQRSYVAPASFLGAPDAAVLGAAPASDATGEASPQVTPIRTSRTANDAVAQVAASDPLAVSDSGLASAVSVSPIKSFASTSALSGVVKAAAPRAVATSAGSRPAAAPSHRQAASARAAAAGSATGAWSSSASDSARAGDGSSYSAGTSGGQGPGAPSPDAAAMVQAGPPPAAATSEAGSASAPAPASSESSQPKAAPAMTAQAARVREIDLDLAQGGHQDVTMTVRLADDKLGVVIRAASAATASAIEGTRDAIAERLAAIGQPVSSLIIQQTGANDATGAAGQSASGDGDARQGNDGEASDPRGARRGASRF
jgi:hypothetical protein